MFKVSDKVVLIERIRAARCFRPALQAGKIYVVREVDDDREGGSGLRLVGVRGVQEDGEEVWVAADKFRLHGSPAPEKPAHVNLPMVKVKFMSDEDFNRMAEGQAQAIRLIKDALTAAQQSLHVGGYRDPQAEVLGSLKLARRDWKIAMEPGTGKEGRKRSFFAKYPEPGDALTLSVGGAVVRVELVWKHPGYWRGSVYRRDALCRAMDGRCFLVRETEPHMFVPPPHAQWLNGLVRVKRMTRRAALRFVLRSGSAAFAQDVFDELDAKIANGQPDGCTVRFHDTDGDGHFNVKLDAEETALIEERAQATGTEFFEVVLDMVRRGTADRADAAADAVVRRCAADPEDIALLAAFAPTDEGDESEDDQLPPDDGGEQENRQEPK